MATWTSINNLDSSSPYMEQMIFFHDYTTIILLTIMTIITFMMIINFFNKFIDRYMMENQLIETTWTIVPMVTLMFIAIPSLQLLYLIEEINFPTLTVKAIGHQWYWSYELSDLKNIEFDSFMKKKTENFEFRMLDVDNRLPIPYKSQIRLLASSTDVIHSWTIPSSGIKIDANPGRLNQANLCSNQTSIFYGQCSKICGMNHKFMPIVIESIKPSNFINWVKNF
uniref:Cytochrome c oxidase subunit 2 n=1 Tax=Brasilocerus sp. 2 DTA-2012 TaxID=1176494 RepID=A0A0H3UL08_9COLE|nr:cytochrome c oxidase subunit II [Brasilocerus sp. 2 DTA-2012]